MGVVKWEEFGEKRRRKGMGVVKWEEFGEKEKDFFRQNRK